MGERERDCRLNTDHAPPGLQWLAGTKLDVPLECLTCGTALAR